MSNDRNLSKDYMEMEKFKMDVRDEQRKVEQFDEQKRFWKANETHWKIITILGILALFVNAMKN